MNFKKLISVASFTMVFSGIASAQTSQLPSSCFAAAVAVAKNVVIAEYQGTVTFNEKTQAKGNKILVHLQSSEFDDPLEVAVKVAPGYNGECRVVGKPELFNEDPS